MDAVSALALLVDAEVETMDRAGLDRVLAARRVVCALTDGVQIRVARRARVLAQEGRSESPDEVLRENGRRSGREAATAARREEACARLPVFEPALADGSVTTGHLDALAAATAGLSDAQRAEVAEHEAVLLADATRSSVDVFERHCRDLVNRLAIDDGADRLAALRRRNRVRRWIDHVTGMHHLHAELDPESAAKVWTAINHQLATLRHQQSTATGASIDTATGPTVPSSGAGPGDGGSSSSTEQLSFDQLEAQAFIDLITGAQTLDRRVPEVIVVLDLDTLVHGLHDGGLCETADGIPLPPSTVRRLCCQADIIPAVLDGDGEVLDLGRSRRLATAAQRRALYAMYTTCGYPACRTPVERCEIHHVLQWLHHHGPTNLDNLIPLCSRHHHLVHEGGWQLTLARHRVITLTRPDGTIHHRGTTTDRAHQRGHRPPDPATGRVSAGDTDAAGRGR